MVIIAICGFQGVGKDTFSNYLVSKYNFVKFSFASATKDVLSVMFGWDRKLLEGDTIESRKFRESIDTWWSSKLSIDDLTPRKMLQIIGTDLFRNNFNSEIWISIVEKKIIDILKLNPNQKIIISDCRFPNEIKMAKNLGAKLIHIHRNLPEWFDTYKNGFECEQVKKLHESDISWIREDFDYVIENNFPNINDFENEIDCFFSNNYGIEICQEKI